MHPQPGGSANPALTHEANGANPGSASGVSFRAPWHPVLPALFVTAAVFVVISSVASNPRNALYGIVLIGAGVPAFLGWARKTARER